VPELPDLSAYVQALHDRVAGRQLSGIRIISPFVLRTVTPAPASFDGANAIAVSRIGKQVVLEFDADRFIVVHLMIAGRFQWAPGEAPAAKRRTVLATFRFSSGLLILTEAGSRKRASIHLVHGRDQLAAFDRGGLDVMGASLDAFRQALTREDHTLKRALTDPRLFSGIGNAYSDEILHRARLSPLALTSRLDGPSIERLWAAATGTLTACVERHVSAARDRFPSRVSAFQPGMAVHGRFGKPCPVCQSPVQRIVYAANECNYCPRCQTNGTLLADRALSRLLKRDWPRSLDELEAHIEARRDPSAKV